MKNAFILVSLAVCFGLISPAQATSVTTLVISEVFYDQVNGDNTYEWVELFNGTATAIDLSDWSLGWGGDDYTYGSLQLSGSIAADSYFVVGGPNSDDSNGNPAFDLALDFSPDLQNSGTNGGTADGVALFNLPKDAVDTTTTPFFSIIYGTTNSNNLLDSSGNSGSVDVDDAPAGQSIEFDGSGWTVNSSPTPGSGPLTSAPPSPVPEPSTGLLFGSALAGLGVYTRKRKKR